MKRIRKTTKTEGKRDEKIKAKLKRIRKPTKRKRGKRKNERSKKEECHLLGKAIKEKRKEGKRERKSRNCSWSNKGKIRKNKDDGSSKTEKRRKINRGELGGEKVYEKGGC